MANPMQLVQLGKLAILLLLLSGIDGIMAREAFSQSSIKTHFLNKVQPTTVLPQEPAPAPPLQELLVLVNAERQQAGVPPLVMDENLNQAAQRQAEDLAHRGQLSHVGSDGSTLQTRIEDTGYTWSAIGENIAMGQTSPQAVMDSWMDSTRHRQNILNPAFSELGLGYVEMAGQKYWVQLFATPR